MWSQLIKPDNKDEEVVNDTVKDYLTVIPVVSGQELVFKREIHSFVEEHKDILDKLYNKHFKDYNHISKKVFYIFAYANTNERYRR